ncbi:hypothetical protein RFI_26603, partial [Reticulomyxa filosa]
SIRLWDIRSGQQIQIFNRHTNTVHAVEYSPFITKNSNGNSNVICSGSGDNTICFWDIRSNKNELYMIKGDEKEDEGILCLKFIELKKKKKTNDITHDWNLCYEMKVFLFEKVILTLFDLIEWKHCKNMFCLTLLF